MTAARIIIMTRFPEPGRVKTRLIAAIGDDLAAQVHAALLERALEAATAAAERTGANLEVRLCGGEPGAFADAFDFRGRVMDQGAGDLGERMGRAVRDAETAGFSRVALIGSDCPALDSHAITRALGLLDEAPAVMAPATDDGYVLLGLRRFVAALFEAMPWSTDRVFEETMRRARDAGMEPHVMETFADVDRPEDLDHAGPYLPAELIARIDAHRSAARG